jgi:hypothetical protein
MFQDPDTFTIVQFDELQNLFVLPKNPLSDSARLRGCTLLSDPLSPVRCLTTYGCFDFHVNIFFLPDGKPEIVVAILRHFSNNDSIHTRRVLWQQ